MHDIIKLPCTLRHNDDRGYLVVRICCIRHFIKTILSVLQNPTTTTLDARTKYTDIHSRLLMTSTEDMQKKKPKKNGNINDISLVIIMYNKKQFFKDNTYCLK